MPPQNNNLIEYAVIGGYLLVLVAVGFVFRRFNANVSDYFRNGCKGTWWLVGASAFMTMFSAFTFTGAAGAAFESGFGVMIIFIGNALGFFLVFAFLGPWYRQMRVITAPEAIRARYGPTTQQFYAWFGMVLGVIYAALWLNGLSIFVAAVFGYDVTTVIWITGLVVLIYSVFGGSWAVMATDFLQFVILVPLTVLVAVLALGEVGGISGFFATIQQQNLNEQFRLINDPAVRFAGNPDKIKLGQYGLAFAAATLMWKAMLNMSLTAAPRYFAAKDGRAARKAALLACMLMILGMVVWFIPPMVARMTIADEVMAAEWTKPAETAYALISIRLLPTGLTGLMVVAMFAATMSSMDTGLNRNAAIFTRDIFPPLCRIVGIKQPGDHAMLRLSQVFSLMFGCMIIAFALYLASLKEGKGIFEHMLNVGALLGAPMTIPMLMALFIKRVPYWSAIVAVLAALVPSAMAFFSGSIDNWPAWVPAWCTDLMAEKWTYQEKIFANSAVGVLAFLATMPFWRTARPAYRAQVDAFFTQMHKPVDFAHEVGRPNDPSQLKIIGAFAAVVGFFICGLMLLPNPISGRLSILFVGGTVMGVGLLLFWVGNRAKPTAAPPAVEGTTALSDSYKAV